MTIAALGRRSVAHAGAALRRDCAAASARPVVTFAAISGDHLRRDQHSSLVPGWLLVRPNNRLHARLPPSPSRSSSRIAWPLSHPARHPSQMVTVGRIRANGVSRRSAAPRHLLLGDHLQATDLSFGE